MTSLSNWGFPLYFPIVICCPIQRFLLLHTFVWDYIITSSQAPPNNRWFCNGLIISANLFLFDFFFIKQTDLPLIAIFDTSDFSPARYRYHEL